MSTGAVERNKQTVQRLFEAFRAGDTDAFDALIVEEYAQHNPQVANGREAVKEFFGSVGPVDVEVYRTIGEGDLVAVHSHFESFDMAGVDISQRSEEDRRALGRAPAGT